MHARVDRAIIGRHLWEAEQADALDTETGRRDARAHWTKAYNVAAESTQAAAAEIKRQLFLGPAGRRKALGLALHAAWCTQIMVTVHDEIEREIPS